MPGHRDCRCRSWRHSVSGAQRKLVWLNRSEAGMGAQTRLEGSVELA